MKTLINFARAMWVWLRGGMYLLDHYMINVRLDVCQNHCQGGHYKKGWFRHYCDACNCTISHRRTPFNKLAHPCQGCPKGYWSKFGGCDTECGGCESE